MRPLDPIAVTREACREYAQSSKLEWLETNGTGGYAMGTVSGGNTRRYHGLLVASLRPPVERYMLLAKLEEEVAIGDRVIELGANQYPGTLHPTGFEHLDGFRLDPFPIWTYEAAGARIEKRVFLVQGKQTVVIQYRADCACQLRARPFLAFRDYHSLGHANSYLDSRIWQEPGRLSVRPYSGLPEMRFHHNASLFEPARNWYFDLEYLAELDRGLDFREDLFSPGAFLFDVAPEAPAWLVATIEDGTFDRAAVEQLEREHLARSARQHDDPFLARLSIAADQFRVRRADGEPTIIAGYPWFTDWGRDTMISLPGLLVRCRSAPNSRRGLLDEFRSVIQCFLQHMNQGLIPNRFPDRGETTEYNTADATLWMFQAVHAYQQAGGDVSFFYPAGKQIIDWHQFGTLNDIRVDPADGLLSAGGPGTQLTWMDAKVGDWVVTPRNGKPVEINALWYNALRLMETWARELGDVAAARSYTRAARQAKTSFAKFWNEARGCLYDVLRPEGPDPKLRPNQIFAVSLAFSPLTRDQQSAVVKAVETALLTPVGLRTLSSDDPDYQPHYRGDPRSRDAAYHQGSVWPWLLGPFIGAYLTAFGRSKRNLAYCRSLLAALEPQLYTGCLGSIGEIFEGEPPHHPCGAVAQAWSVAEPLRVLCALETEVISSPVLLQQYENSDRYG